MNNFMTEQERIEKDAIKYEDKNPYDAVHSAYYMGAKTERNKTVDLCLMEFAKWLTEPAALGKVYTDKIESLKL